MAEAAKKTANAYPKQFRVPADLPPLESYGTIIIHQMRKHHNWRMTDGVKQIRKGAQKK
jgi:hypothetical protein